ncbi:hypothetical protein [Butyrivibrio fibrisolvens]|uniref:hypothetical protein n=1 Tax=Butyrivibrio fibrisolvens TaxID=831 RepID=UPI0020BD4FFB|nr:hypothetical protein [Butyrivibrio fibrisolvens]
MIAIGMFFSFFIGLFIFVTIHGRDVSNVTSSISIKKTIIQNSFSDNQESSNYEYKNDLELKYYNTIEEAISHKEILDKTAEVSESAILKIMQLENEEAYIVCAEKDGSVSGQSIYWYKLKIKDGMYSQPYDYSGTVSNMKKMPPYRYDFDDYISQIVVWSIASPQYDIQTDSGDSIYIFGWDNKDEVYGLTINGVKPNDIIEYELGGKTYFYFEYMRSDIVQQLLDNVNLSSFTLKQVSDAIDINY